jgi:hypothetical protein
VRHAPANGARVRRRPTRTNWTAAALGCCALWLLAGCRKPAETDPAVVIEPEIAPRPARIGLATVTLRLSDAAGQPVRQARIALEADMAHPGMRPEFGAAREVAAGRYQGQLTFTMAGDWVVVIHATLPGGRKLERQMEVNGVR